MDPVFQFVCDIMKRKKYLINKIYKFTMRADKQIHEEPMEYRLKIGSTKIGSHLLSLFTWEYIITYKIQYDRQSPYKTTLTH